jgi:aryl-alcohol dehydrogenase-like predicted oxidoreductase
MDQRPLGSTGLHVSEIGFGAWAIGGSWGHVEEDQAVAALHAALDAGVTFLDTADVYGGTDSEAFLGRVLRGRRDLVVLATKFGMPVRDGAQGAHPDYVKRALADSLRRLGTDHVDLYQLHRPDPDVPIADTLGALDELVQAGMVRAIGCSNFSVAQLDEAAAEVVAAEADDGDLQGAERSGVHGPTQPRRSRAWASVCTPPDACLGRPVHDGVR